MPNHESIRISVPYRSRNGIIFGVCRGLAKHLDVPVGVVRLLFVIGFFCTGLWPVGIGYILAGVLMKIEPAVPFHDEGEAEFYHSYAGSREMALQRLKRTYDHLDRRIQRIESTVTARDYDWERRLNQTPAGEETS